MESQGVNSAGVSVAGGISADCNATDDTANDFGLGEGMLQSALDYIANGTCDTEIVVASRSLDGQEKSAPKLLKSAEHLLLESIRE